MTNLSTEARLFTAGRSLAQADAVQRVALQLLCGLDFDILISADAQSRMAAIAKLERMIVRERQKGLSRHWSYDLNRHIALKQARDRLCDTLGKPKTKPPKRIQTSLTDRRGSRRTGL